MDSQLKLTYEERAKMAVNPAARNLFNLMAKKKTNLAIAADHTDANEILELAELLGADIAVFKTHVDIWNNFSPEVIQELIAISKKHNFIIFEDRKFADIGNTVRMQYSGGMYKIADWAHIVNVHLVPGPAIIDAIWNVAKEKNDGIERGVLVLAQMSSEGTFAQGEYTKKCVQIANTKKDAIAGYIGTGSDPCELQKLSSISFEGHAILTPGVQLESKGDKLGQKYATPEDAVLAGSDAIIVGRGIYGSGNPKEMAKEYRDAGWNAYLKRIRA
ncbi:MAG: orotidine-5'-phosphate decarboxylase [Nanoarchaeota archaeon]|nr:orotidine-5'-phosphate decarboxylase [Nanoarchaeota archaeon]MBU4300734.1 orotidine-5'-phosphate decarboxylase [Nanoarchaeota archaeon]MBU4452398.1 orotidine-5'-phosphate decarboxylase [Nanoarchaeota archaeon]MCG2723326.1 orotidine-5'-phosphate decarboxylase [archaeon]